MARFAPALAVAMVLLLQAVGAWRPLERAWFDHAATGGTRFAVREVALVAIDDDSVARLGPWPWPAERMARLVERLGVAGARSVVLAGDLGPAPVDAALASAIAKNGRTLLAQRHHGETLQAPLPGYAAGAVGVGHLDWAPDSDGTVRRVMMVPRGDGFSAPSLALLAAARQAGTVPGAGRRASAAASMARPASAPSLEAGRLVLGPHAYALGDDGALVPRWLANGVVPPSARESAHVLLAGAGSAARFAGKVVVVGATLPGAPSIDTPARDAVPEAEALAQVISALLRGGVLEAPTWLHVLATLMALAAAAGVPWLARQLTRPSAWLCVAVVALGCLVASNVVSQLGTLWWPGVTPALAWLAAQAARHGADRWWPGAVDAPSTARAVPSWAHGAESDTVPSEAPPSSRPTPSSVSSEAPDSRGGPASVPPPGPRTAQAPSPESPAPESTGARPQAGAAPPGAMTEPPSAPPPSSRPGEPDFEPTIVMPPPSATPMFGSYPLVRETARGALGSVYLAHDPVHGYPVAIKTLALARHYDGLALAQARRDLADQVAAAAALRHPDIVSTLGCGEHDGLDFVLSEWVDGDDFARLMRQGAAQSSVTGLLRTIARVSKAVAYAHRQGLMHGAIRPSQILIDPSAHRVTLQGFGTAAILRDVALKSQSGPLLLFLAPELLAPGAPARLQRRDPRSDIFGLAAVLYFGLTGQPPRADVASRHAPDPRALRPDLPTSLAELLSASLSPDLDVRPRDGLAFAEGLQAAFEQLGGVASRPMPLRDA